MCCRCGTRSQPKIRARTGRSRRAPGSTPPEPAPTCTPRHTQLPRAASYTRRCERVSPAARRICSGRTGTGRETAMKIEGGCHCGYIAYEAEVDPERVLICHCTDCQTLSGSRSARSRFRARELQGSFGETEDLREDRREREQAAAVLLPGMRHADFFDIARRRSQQGALAARRIDPPARSAHPEAAVVDALVAALAWRNAVNAGGGAGLTTITLSASSTGAGTSSVRND